MMDSSSTGPLVRKAIIGLPAPGFMLPRKMIQDFEGSPEPDPSPSEEMSGVSVDTDGSKMSPCREPGYSDRESLQELQRIIQEERKQSSSLRRLLVEVWDNLDQDTQGMLGVKVDSLWMKIHEIKKDDFRMNTTAMYQSLKRTNQLLLARLESFEARRMKTQ